LGLLAGAGKVHTATQHRTAKAPIRPANGCFPNRTCIPMVCVACSPRVVRNAPFEMADNSLLTGATFSFYASAADHSRFPCRNVGFVLSRWAIDKTPALALLSNR
jgi:hypothetical protein